MSVPNFPPLVSLSLHMEWKGGPSDRAKSETLAPSPAASPCAPFQGSSSFALQGRGYGTVNIDNGGCSRPVPNVLYTHITRVGEPIVDRTDLSNGRIGGHLGVCSTRPPTDRPTWIGGRQGEVACGNCVRTVGTAPRSRWFARPNFKHSRPSRARALLWARKTPSPPPLSPT